MALVADHLRRHVLVAARVLGDRRGMQAGLVGEGAGADVGGVPVGNAIEPLVHRARDLGQTAQPRLRHAGRIAQLEHQRRDQGDQIGVAAALAEAVQRALHLACAGAHGGERVGDRVLGVVVGVDAEPVRRDRCRDPLDDCPRSRAAGGRHWCRTARSSGRHRVLRHRGRRARTPDRPGSRRRSARRRTAPRARAGTAAATLSSIMRRFSSSATPSASSTCVGRALADQGDRIGAALEQRRKARIVRGAAAGAPGHPKCAELGLGEHRRVREEAVVGGIGARPAAFDVVDPELIEQLRDCHLVGDGEVDAVGLAAVAQRGVVEIDPLGHGGGRMMPVLAGQAPARERERYQMRPPRSMPAADRAQLSCAFPQPSASLTRGDRTTGRCRKIAHSGRATLGACINLARRHPDKRGERESSSPVGRRRCRAG